MTTGLHGGSGAAPLVVVGDALLDVDVRGTVERVCPDAPAPVLDAEREDARPGGAALTALLAARTGDRPVRLVTALADPDRDPAAARLLALLSPDVEVVALPATGTTAVKTRMLAGDRPLLRCDSGGLDAPGSSSVDGADEPAVRAACAAIASAGVLLVSDYGRGVAEHPELRAALSAAPAPLVWDPHPRGPAPLPGATVVTPNLAEARAACPAAPRATDPLDVAADAARRLRRHWRVGAVVVTAGEHGAAHCVADGDGGVGVAAPAPVPSGTGDACGAGDRFAAALAVMLGADASVADAVARAVAAAGAFVAAGGAGAVRRHGATWTVPGADARRGSTGGGSCDELGDEVADVLDRTRARGGRVVATGGCFDLVHAGHARTLDAARRLAGADGAVVVCLNSDDSVRRLKGATRPLIGQDERAELLRALRSVDAVVVFGEDDPRVVLERLRPDLWVKGGDYDVEHLAETPLVRSWGGDVVTVGFHAGRSTTALAGRLEPLGGSS